jgi:hypothetical protein
MPKLDTKGDIAAATIAFYVPVAVVALALTIRYGLRRDAGWIFLFTFALGSHHRSLLLTDGAEIMCS